MTFPVTEHTVKTNRHTTGYLACGAEGGPLLIFCHGWPELSLSWRHQLPAMAALGFRCVAPDMRGYGRSSTYTRHEDFTQELIVGDMLELLTRWAATGRCGSVTTGAARWCGTWRRTIRRRRPAWRAFACPISRPATVENRLPLVDRSVYPVDLYPVGQWDYHFFYEESFDKARTDFEANIRNAVKAMFRKGNPASVGKPAATASVRRNGGWFGGGACPDVPRDGDVITEQDLEAYGAALTRNGFFGPNSWYMNHKANAEYARRSKAAQARDAGAVPARRLRYDLRDRELALRRADAPGLHRPHRSRREIRPLDGAGAAGGRQRGPCRVAGDEAAGLLELGMTFPVANTPSRPPATPQAISPAERKPRRC